MKTLRYRLIAGALVIVAMAAVVFCLRTSRHSLTSPDGQIRFIRVNYQRGTLFSIALGSRVEAWIRDTLFDLGLRRVTRTSLKMSSPPNSHVFVLEYSGDTGDMQPNLIRAELVRNNGMQYDLISVGSGPYGIQKRQFAYWVLNGVERLHPH